MDERDWYDRMDRHPALRERNNEDSVRMRGHCGDCRSTGQVGSGNYGPPGVSGYWCRRHGVPVSGNLTCDNYVSDR